MNNNCTPCCTIFIATYFESKLNINFFQIFVNSLIINALILIQQVRFELLKTKDITTLRDFERFLCKEFQDYNKFIALYAVQDSNLTFVCTVPAFIEENLVDHINKNQYRLSSWSLQDVIVRDKSVLDKPIVQVSCLDITVMYTDPNLYGQ